MLLDGKPILPRNLGRQLTIALYHTTHLGAMKTAELLRLNFGKTPLLDAHSVLG